MIVYILIFFVVGVVAFRLPQWRLRRAVQLERLKMEHCRSLLVGLYSSEGQSLLLRVESAAAFEQMAVLLAEMRGTLAHLNNEYLRDVALGVGLYDYLIRRVERTRGAARARYLALLSQMPPFEAVAARLVRYSGARSRDVRFFALMARMNARREDFVVLLESYEDSLSMFEVVEIVRFVRSGAVFVAYDKLLESRNENLQMVGMAIVRAFLLEQAAERLYAVIECGDSPRLSYVAFLTLCKLNVPMRQSVMKSYLLSLSEGRRHELLRYIASLGYSERSLARMLYDVDYLYYKSLVSSYKSPMLCI